MTHTEILQSAYDKAEKIAENESSGWLEGNEIPEVEVIADHAETNKGLIAVLTTLLAHKEYDPDQDIRYHQAQLPNGFSGRTIDTEEVTPFMKSVNFPSMSESGWLTRSLEQAQPYTLDYPGKITPKSVKDAFLTIVDDVQTKDENPMALLTYLFALLIKQRDKQTVDLAKPHNLSISTIINLLEKHFTYKYPCSGASRLPVLAIYAAYQCMMTQVARYEGKILCPLESHNSADLQSGRIGDIDVDNADGTAFEGVEVMHNKQITAQLVADAYEKFKAYHTDRYYLLTTANMDSADWDAIDAEIEKTRQIHGCQVIVNGVYSTLKYYLRLVKDPSEFIDNYVELIKADPSIKFQHKEAWNKIIGSDLIHE